MFQSQVLKTKIFFTLALENSKYTHKGKGNPQIAIKVFRVWLKYLYQEWRVSQFSLFLRHGLSPQPRLAPAFTEMLLLQVPTYWDCSFSPALGRLLNAAWFLPAALQNSAALRSGSCVHCFHFILFSVPVSLLFYLFVFI